MKALISRFPVLTLATAVLAIQFCIVGVVASMIPEGQRLREAPDAHAVFRFRVFWPLVFAVLITYYIEGRAGVAYLFRSFRVWRVPGRFYAFGLAWKFLFCLLAWAIADVTGLLPWPGAVVDNFFGGDWSQSYHLLLTTPYIIGIAIVEETTWMKFCVTRLQARYSAFVACLFTGTAWGLWYLPMLLLHEGVPDGVPWYMFLLSMIGLTVLLAWVYNMTQSGLAILVMQLMSNATFFIMPALPAWHDMDPSYVTAFIWCEITIAALIVIVYGTKELGIRPRPFWKVEDLESAENERDQSQSAVRAA